MSKSSHRRCSVRKVFLEISQNSQENACARASKIETLAQVFSCEFCEISKNTFFTEHVWASASGCLLLGTLLLMTALMYSLPNV